MMKKILYLFLTSMCFMTSLQASAKPAPQIDKGIINLHGWDFNAEGPVALNGDWEFYWRELRSPDSFKKEQDLMTRHYIKVPRYWNNQSITGKKLPEDGFATYRLRLELGSPRHHLALKINDILSSYNLYINESLVAKVGAVGKNKDESSWKTYSSLYEIPEGVASLDIIIQVSNFNNINAGIHKKIILGTYNTLHAEWLWSVLIDFFLFGSLLIMGLYHFGLFVQRRRDISSLLFGLFCVMLGVRSIITGQKILIYLFPHIPTQVYFRVDLLSLYAGFPITIMFIIFVFDKDFPVWFQRLIIGSGIFYSSLALFFPSKVYLSVLSSFHIFACIVSIYVFAIIISFIVKKRPGAVIIFIGSMIFFATALNDILIVHAIIYSTFLLPFGAFIMIFSQAFILSQKFSNAFFSVEYLTVELSNMNNMLEEKVRQRTEDLEDAMTELTDTNNELVIIRDSLWGEMELAHKIQTILLPDNPDIQGWEISAYMKPTESVGGDYYDIIKGDDRFWVIIGDVSGHGVGAGLVTMMVQSIIQAKLRDNFTIEPSVLLNYVSKAYKYNILKIDQSRFMSVAAFSFKQDGTISFSGRHDDPIFYRSCDQKIEFLQTGGKLLSAWDPKRTVTDGSIKMEQGDFIFMYTDGITESQKDSGEMFGIEKLGALVRESGSCSPAEIRDRVIHELAGYTVDDDITMVIVKKI